MVMLVISLILTFIFAIISILLLKRATHIRNLNFIEATLVRVERIKESSHKSFEATYRYTVNGKIKLYVSDRKLKKASSFDKTIKLYYSGNKFESPFEKPSEQLMFINMAATALCLVADLVYAILL